MSKQTNATPKTMECPRCEGTQVIKGCAHVKDGVCFRCGGTGVVPYRKTHTKTLDQRMADKAKRDAKKETQRAIEQQRDAIRSERALAMFATTANPYYFARNPYAATKEAAMRSNSVWFFLHKDEYEIYDITVSWWAN